MNTQSDWVTTDQAAAILGVPLQAVYRQINDGRIPGAAIRPRKKREAILIHRAHLVSGQTNNLTQFPVSQLSEVDIERIAHRTSALVLDALSGVFRKVG